MKKVIALTLSLMFVWSALNPQSVYAGTNNKLKTEPINIAFCFDEKWWMQAGVAITSLLCMAEERGTASKCCYNIYCVVPDSVTQTMRNILRSLVKKRSPLSSIKFLAVTNQFDNVAVDCSQKEVQKKGATYYRLLLHELLPDLDKIIYTDVDLIFNDDLQELDKIDVSKYYVAGAIDTFRNKENFQNKIWDEYGLLYDLNDKGQYLNAGVLILNLKKIRQDGIDKKWFQLINIDFPLRDQDMINISCADNVLVLSNDYNFLVQGCYTANNPRIFHFAGYYKPWEAEYTSKCSDIWWYYAGQTPFVSYFTKSMMQGQYNMLQRQHDDKFKVLPKWLCRFCSCFILKKESRHKFRRKYMAEY